VRNVEAFEGGEQCGWTVETGLGGVDLIKLFCTLVDLQAIRCQDPLAKVRSGLPITNTRAGPIPLATISH